MFDGRPIRLGDVIPELMLATLVMGVAWIVAIPRLAAGSTPTREEHALVTGLELLRGAIAQYTKDHGGLRPDAALIARQLTLHTSDAGLVCPVRDGVHRHGPYLRRVPSLSVGAWAGVSAIGEPGAFGCAWIYDASTGRVTPNTGPSDLDARGLAYADY
jgi:type II secretory pathway pseudopilin PulG